MGRRSNDDSGNDSNDKGMMRKSVNMILHVVAEQERQVPRNHIFLGGVGQGCAAALAAFLADGTGEFAGLIGLGGWFPRVKEAEEMGWRHVCSPTGELFAAVQTLYNRGGEDDGADVPGATAVPEPVPRWMKGTPILMEHFVHDAIIPFENGRRAKQFLEKVGLRVDWRAYDEGGEYGINKPRGVGVWAILSWQKCKAWIVGRRKIFQPREGAQRQWLNVEGGSMPWR